MKAPEGLTSAELMEISNALNHLRWILAAVHLQVPAVQPQLRTEAQSLAILADKVKELAKALENGNKQNV